MELITALPVWALAILIFCFRIFDVSLGTLRTISVVQGRLFTSVTIGFFEVLFWVTAVSQVIVRIGESPILPLAFAGGFAAGNACGIALERRLSIGKCVIRMITTRDGETIAARLREMGYAITTFAGQGHDGPRTLLFTSCPRRDVKRVTGAAAALDPGLTFTVDRFSQSGGITPLPHPTGWRAVFKKK